MRPILLILTFLVFAVSLASAQTRCRTQLTYKWKPADGEKSVEIKWGEYEGQGVDDATARAQISSLVEKERVKARETCRREHENLAGCYSAKFASLGPVLQGLDFSARKSMEEAITSDCKKQQGRCDEPAIAEPVCVVEATPVPAEGAKEEKGKKKKK